MTGFQIKVVSTHKITQSKGDLDDNQSNNESCFNNFFKKNFFKTKIQDKLKADIIYRNILLVLRNLIEENENLIESEGESLPFKKSKIVKRFCFRKKNPQKISFSECFIMIKKILEPQISTVILALIYLDKISQVSQNMIKIQNQNIYKLFVIAFYIAHKYNEDCHFQLIDISHVTRIPVHELIELEMLFFFKLIKFDLFISDDIYNQYYTYLLNY